MSRIDASTHTHIIIQEWISSDPSVHLCRNCGQIVVKSKIQRKTWYCNDKCRQEYFDKIWRVSWLCIREEVYKRDGGMCQKCGKKLCATINDAITEDVVAEVHHIIPVVELNRIAWEASREAPEDKRSYWFDKFRMMLQLDMNNLILLCSLPCHDDAHNHISNQLRKNKGSTLDKWSAPPSSAGAL